MEKINKTDLLNAIKDFNELSVKIKYKDMNDIKNMGLDLMNTSENMTDVNFKGIACTIKIINDVAQLDTIIECWDACGELDFTTIDLHSSSMQEVIINLLDKIQ